MSSPRNSIRIERKTLDIKGPISFSGVPGVPIHFAGVSLDPSYKLNSGITNLFNLKPSDIEDIHFTPCGSLTQCNIVLAQRPTSCPSCGKTSRLVHDYTNRTLRHSVLAEHDLIVNYRKRHYYCDACQKPFPERSPSSLLGKRISSATVIRIMKLLQMDNMTFSSVAYLNGVSTTTVMKVFDEHAGVSSIPLPRCMCIDMYENYRDLAHRYFTNALVCVDSFHVIKNINVMATYHNAEQYLNKYIDDIRVFGVSEFQPVASMLKHWKAETVNSFLTYRGRRISNGPIESMNSRIKKIKRNGNGYTNFYRFRLRCLYTLNKGSSIKF